MVISSSNHCYIGTPGVNTMNESLAKGLISGMAYSQGRNKVSNRPVKEILLTTQDLIDMYYNQKGLCYWSKLPLNPIYNSIKHHPFAISPERLDNALPYDKDNVVLCRRIFNLGRMSFPEKAFEQVMMQLKEEYNNQADIEIPYRERTPPLLGLEC
jgi:hypothetical protein